MADPVASAMDTAFALCHTTYMYCTHADCFIRRGDWLEWLVSRCGEIHPVVGYQMSDRSRHTRDWEWMVSHTATMLHMPTMLRVGACWSLQKYHAMKAVFPVDNPDWLDTETGFNWTLRRAGILPLLLASEVNFERQTDENIDHVRSYPSATLYQVGTPEYRASRETWMETAIQEAKERVRAWSQAPRRSSAGWSLAGGLIPGDRSADAARQHGLEPGDKPLDRGVLDDRLPVDQIDHRRIRFLGIGGSRCTAALQLQRPVGAAAGVIMIDLDRLDPDGRKAPSTLSPHSLTDQCPALYLG